MTAGQRLKADLAEYSRPLTGSVKISLLILATLTGSVLLMLAVVGVQPDTKHPTSLQEMIRNAALYHQRVPTLISIPSIPFSLLVWSSVVALWIGYLWLVWSLQEHDVSPAIAATGAVGLAALALLVPPLFTTDTFSYALFGRLASVYHLNPYVASARDVPADPLTPYLYWRGISSPYGPLWTLLSSTITQGAQTSALALVFRFKLLATCAELVDGVMIYRLVRERWPMNAGWAYLAFAWNPLVLIEGVVLGHNDVLILAMLLGAALLLTRRPAIAALGVGASVLIKYSTVPLVALTLARAYTRSSRNSRRRAMVHSLMASLAIAALTVVCFLPFWTGPGIVISTIREPGRGINNPIFVALGWSLAAVTGRQLAPPMVCCAVGGLLFTVWQFRDFRTEKIESTDSAHAVYLDLASWSRASTMFLVIWPRIHTWYFLPPIGLALAAGPGHRRLFWVVLSAALIAYVTYFY